MWLPFLDAAVTHLKLRKIPLRTKNKGEKSAKKEEEKVPVETSLLWLGPEE